MAQLRFKELFHLIRAFKTAGLYRVTVLYNQLVMDIEMAAPLLNAIISVYYLSAPFIFSLLWHLSFYFSGLTRIIALFNLLLVFTFNYIMYWKASSICLMNKVIVKHLHPIQSDKTDNTRLTRLTRLRIDSFVDRLNNEFVGFQCLYSIEFTRMSFYEYALGISGTYFLFSDLNPL